MRETAIMPVRKGDSVTLLDADKANELIAYVNDLLVPDIVFTRSAPTSLIYSPGRGGVVIQLNTKDIDLGVISGSAGGNAALSSLITALGRTFTVSDQTS